MSIIENTEHEALYFLWWTSGDNVYTQDDHKTIIAYSDFIYENLSEINKETERWIGILWNNYQEWLLK